MITEDVRLSDVQQWLSDILGQEFILTSVAGDASFRRFFRVRTSGKTYILVDAPPESNENEAFVLYNKLFKKINTPDIYEVNMEKGFILEEDFGDESFFMRTNRERDMALYRKAVDCLIEFQKLSRPDVLPPYTEKILTTEMNRFREWYREKYLHSGLFGDDEILWNELVRIVAQRCLNQKSTFVYRDFHSRNMMVLEDGELGMIDYQDALYGPVTYDLVSLLKDAYIKLSSNEVEIMIKYYLDKSVFAIDHYEFVKDFDYMGLQRHLKILGLFARLSIRDGKHGYLKDIPLIKEYILAVLNKYGELNKFVKLLE